LDDADRLLVAGRRGESNRLGFALQLGVVRLLGTFLADLGEVPVVAVDFVAEQLAITDRSCLVAYAGREKTRLEHVWEIAREYGYRDFAVVEKELTRRIDDRAWTSGDGPRALFAGAVGWLRERLVLFGGWLTRCAGEWKISGAWSRREREPRSPCKRQQHSEEAPHCAALRGRRIRWNIP